MFLQRISIDGSSHIPFRLLAFVCLAIDLLIMLARIVFQFYSQRALICVTFKHVRTHRPICHTEAMQLYQEISE